MDTSRIPNTPIQSSDAFLVATKQPQQGSFISNLSVVSACSAMLSVGIEIFTRRTDKFPTKIATAKPATAKQVMSHVSEPSSELDQAFEILKDYAHAYRGIGTRLGLSDANACSDDSRKSDEDKLLHILTTYQAGSGNKVDMDLIHGIKVILDFRVQKGQSLEANPALYTYAEVACVPGGRKRARPPEEGRPAKHQHTLIDLTDDDDGVKIIEKIMEEKMEEKMEVEENAGKAGVEDIFVTGIDQSGGKCALCQKVTSIVKEPIRQLSCGHSFCTSCIKWYMSNIKEKAGRQLNTRTTHGVFENNLFMPSCPTCRKSVDPIPELGIEQSIIGRKSGRFKK